MHELGAAPGRGRAVASIVMAGGRQRICVGQSPRRSTVSATARANPRAASCGREVLGTRKEIRRDEQPERYDGEHETVLLVRREGMREQ